MKSNQPWLPSSSFTSTNNRLNQISHRDRELKDSISELKRYVQGAQTDNKQIPPSTITNKYPPSQCTQCMRLRHHIESISRRHCKEVEAYEQQLHTLRNQIYQRQNYLVKVINSQKASPHGRPNLGIQHIGGYISPREKQIEEGREIQEKVMRLKDKQRKQRQILKHLKSKQLSMVMDGSKISKQDSEESSRFLYSSKLNQTISGDQQKSKPFHREYLSQNDRDHMIPESSPRESEEYESIRSQGKMIEKEVQILQRTVNDLREEISQRQLEQNNIVAENNKLRQENQTIRAKIQQYVYKIEESQRKNQQMTFQVKRNQNMKQSFISENQKLESLLQQYQQLLAEKEKKLVQIQNEMKTFQFQHNIQIQKVKDNQKQKYSIQRDHQIERQKSLIISQFKNDLRDKDILLNELRRTESTLGLDLEKVKEENKLIKQRNSQINTQNTSYFAEIDFLKKQLQEEKRFNQQLQIENGKMSEQISLAKQQIQVFSTNKQLEIKKLTQSLEKVENKLKQKNCQFDKRQRENNFAVGEERKKYQESETENQILNKQIIQLKNENDQLKRQHQHRHSDKDQRISILMNNISEGQRKIFQLESIISGFDSQMHAKDQTLLAISQQLQQSKLIIENQKNELAEHSVIANQRFEQIQKLSSSLSLSQSNLQELQANYNAKQSQKSTEEKIKIDEIKRLEILLYEKDNEIKKQKYLLNSRQQRIDEADREISTLQQQIFGYNENKLQNLKAMEQIMEDRKKQDSERTVLNQEKQKLVMEVKQITNQLTKQIQILKESKLQLQIQRDSLEVQFSRISEEKEQKQKKIKKLEEQIYEQRQHKTQREKYYIQNRQGLKIEKQKKEVELQEVKNTFNNIIKEKQAQMDRLKRRLEDVEKKNNEDILVITEEKKRQISVLKTRYLEEANSLKEHYDQQKLCLQNQVSKIKKQLEQIMLRQSLKSQQLSIKSKEILVFESELRNRMAYIEQLEARNEENKRKYEQNITDLSNKLRQQQEIHGRTDQLLNLKLSERQDLITEKQKQIQKLEQNTFLLSQDIATFKQLKQQTEEKWNKQLNQERNSSTQKEIELRRLIYDLEQKNKQLEEKSWSIQKSLKNREAQITKIEEQKNLLSKELDHKLALLTEQKRHKEEFQSTVDTLKDQVSQSQIIIEQKERELENLKNSFFEQSQKTQALQQQTSSLLLRNESLSSSLSQKQSQLNTTIHQLERSTKLNDQMREEKTKQVNMLKTTQLAFDRKNQTVLDEMQLEQHRLNQELTRKEFDIARMEEEVKTITYRKQILQKSKQKMGEELQQMRTQNQKLNGKILEQEKEMKGQQVSFSSLKQELELINRTLAKRNEKIQQLNQQLVSSEQNNNKLSSDLKTVEDKNNKLETTIHKLFLEKDFHENKPESQESSVPIKLNDDDVLQLYEEVKDQLNVKKVEEIEFPTAKFIDQDNIELIKEGNSKNKKHHYMNQVSNLYHRHLIPARGKLFMLAKSFVQELHLFPNHEYLLEWANRFFQALAEYVIDRTIKTQEHIEREKEIIERKEQEEDDGDGDKFLSEEDMEKIKSSVKSSQKKSMSSESDPILDSIGSIKKNVLLAQDISQAASSEEVQADFQPSYNQEHEFRDPMGFSDVSSVKKSTQSMLTQRQADRHYHQRMRNLKLKGKLQRKLK